MKPTPFPVRLLPSDEIRARECAVKRNDKDATVRNLRQTDRLSDLDIHIMGTRSEIAVAHFLAVPFNDRIILHGDGGGGDLDFRGYAVQVKSRSRHGGTLLFKTLEQFRAELAVLCSMAGEFVWILGWIWRDEFRSSYKDADYHHGPIVVVEQSQLREPLELLRLPRAATVPR